MSTQTTRNSATEGLADTFTTRVLRYIGRGEECEHLLSHFKTLDGVQNVRINIPSSSVVVNFDKAKTTSDNILAAVEEILAAHSLGILQRDLHEEALSTLITLSAVSGILLLGTQLVKKAVPATMFGRLTCFPGLGVLALALPLFKSGIGAFKRSMLPTPTR